MGTKKRTFEEARGMEVEMKPNQKHLKERETPAEKEVLIGFQASANEVKKRLLKMGKKKGYSSFSLICASGKEGEKGQYSGGMVGDVGAIIEGLFYMAKNKPEVKELLSLTVSALQQDEMETLKRGSTAISRIHDEKEITPTLFNILSERGIVVLEQLTNFTEKEVGSWSGIGGGYLKTLTGLMDRHNLKFK